MCYQVLSGWCLSGGGIVSVVFVFVLVGGAVRFDYTHACSGGMSCNSSYRYEFHASTHECKQT